MKQKATWEVSQPSRNANQIFYCRQLISSQHVFRMILSVSRVWDVLIVRFTSSSVLRTRSTEKLLSQVPAATKDDCRGSVKQRLFLETHTTVKYCWRLLLRTSLWSRRVSTRWGWMTRCRSRSWSWCCCTTLGLSSDVGLQEKLREIYL